MINESRLLNTFLDYIQIDSESRNEAAVAQRVAADLTALGCEVSFDDSMAKTGSNTGNLYAYLPGEGEPIIFSAHMDTVVPGNGVKPVITDGVIRSSGDTVLGGDDKSGIAAVVEAIHVITESGLPHRPVQAVFTVCEEIGLFGSKNADPAKLMAKQAVVLDSSGDAGKIITAAPGQYKFNLAVLGKRAHAGVAPEEGISAIQVACEAIANMKLLRVDEETTANIGSIHAQFPTNIVSDRCEIVAECRSRNNDKLAAQAEHMMDCFRTACEKYGATLEGEPALSYVGYSMGAGDSLVKLVTDACAKAGLTPTIAASGGGSDANVFNGLGIKAVNLGTGMAKVHTTSEEITIQNLNNTAELVLAIMTL